MDTHADNTQLLADLVKRARLQGADAADALFIEGRSLSLSMRLGNTEHLERSEGSDLGLRVLIGKRQAMVSTSDTKPDAINELLDRAISMAKAVPEDPYLGLAPDELLATSFPDLEEFDDTEVSEQQLTELAKRAEEAARAVKGVTNSEGAEAGTGRHSMTLVTSNGFARTRLRSSHSLSVSVLAGDGTGMERDYDWASRVYAADLPSPEELGKNAGNQAVRRLNPQKVNSAQVPVVLDPRVSFWMVAHLSSAVNGSSIARGTSFLKDKMGEQIFPSEIQIIDDPLRPRGVKSRSFDGEGVATKKRHIIEDGVLKSWVMDLRSARQLGLETTGHASRGISSPPSPSSSNLYMAPGSITPDQLIADVDGGLYITEFMGMGVNGLTGDYSRGASGFWIDKGELAYPVSEVTVAGNLNNMFNAITVADDLKFRYSNNAPTMRIDGLTLAGK